MKPLCESLIQQKYLACVPAQLYPNSYNEPCNHYFTRKLKQSSQFGVYDERIASLTENRSSPGFLTVAWQRDRRINSY